MRMFPISMEKPVGGRHADAGFVIAVILLWGLGLVTLYASSANYATRAFEDSLYFVKRQLISSCIGLVGLLLFAYVDMSVIRKFLPIIVIGSFVLCACTFIPGFGIEKNGARRWVRFPIVGNFQPSELAKFAVVLFLANLFAKKHDRLNDTAVSVVPAAVGLFLFVGIVFFQDDFSTASFILMIGVSLFFIIGIKLYWFFVMLVFSVPVAILSIFTEVYRVNRLIAFMRPEFDIHGLNYQMNATRKAIMDGGFWGQGIGGGLNKVNAIPEVQADFVFAGWTEAMGLIGVILYFALLFYFAWRAYSIAFHTKDRFSSIGAFGCANIILLQSIMNCGVVCGAFPSTGIPLPFFSAGGSSLIITLCICGFIINVSRLNHTTDECIGDTDSDKINIEEVMEFSL